MGPQAEQLVALIEELGQQLADDGLTGWLPTFRLAQAEIRADDPHGVVRFLRCFGGMGSLNDICLGQTVGPDGRVVWAADTRDRNERFEALKLRAWQLADGLKRSFDRRGLS